MRVGDSPTVASIATFNRGKIRAGFGIEGNCFTDFLTHLFCLPCGVCQEVAETTSRAGQAFGEIATDLNRDLNSGKNETTALVPPGGKAS
jgi:hypothetical protein